MANIYVRSTDGNNSDSGATWALAKADVTGAAAIDSAGDTVWVSQSHSESTAAAIAPNLAGSISTPSRLLCGNDAAEPPTSLATGAVIATTTGNVGFTLFNYVYVYGISFQAGVGDSGTRSISFGSTARQKFERCEFRLETSGASSTMTLSTVGRLDWINCDIRFGASGQKIVTNTAEFSWSGGSVLSGGTSPSALIVPFAGGGLSKVLVEGVDLSNLGSSTDLVSIGVSTRPVSITFRNCKLPASWSGSLVTGTLIPGHYAEMWNCDNADTNYRLWAQGYNGDTKSETTLVKTGGASDGTTPLSWKMTSGSNTSYPLMSLSSPEIQSEFNTTVGSSVTVTVDVLHDSATNLKDNEVWLEVQYLGTSGYPLALFASDAMADVLATAADQTTSSATWTTTGMSNPNTQKLSVTFTPQEEGVFTCTVKLAKASYSVYVDPVAQLS